MSSYDATLCKGIEFIEQINSLHGELCMFLMAMLAQIPQGENSGSMEIVQHDSELGGRQEMEVEFSAKSSLKNDCVLYLKVPALEPCLDGHLFCVRYTTHCCTIWSLFKMSAYSWLRSTRVGCLVPMKALTHSGRMSTRQ